jgi:hypothetical protein
MSDAFYTVEISGLTRNLPLFEVAPRSCHLQHVGDTVVEAAADDLAASFPGNRGRF